MPLIRTFARQGHEVPKGPHSPRGPFPAELFQASERTNGEEHGDSLHEALDNVRMFRCRYCYDILYINELDDHVCEDDDEEYEESEYE